jgi:protein-S-isoprenylcysteine O-methyltransferase Ste14
MLEPKSHKSPSPLNGGFLRKPRPEQQSIFGAGFFIVAVVLVYSLLMWRINSLWPEVLMIPGSPNPILKTIGKILLWVTIGLHLYIGFIIVDFYTSNRLETRGVYGICRNPLYSCWILLGTPGIALLVQSWLFFTIPVFTYIVTRIFVILEEKYLKDAFGQEFIDYKNRVNAIFPTLWKKKPE